MQFLESKSAETTDLFEEKITTIIDQKLGKTDNSLYEISAQIKALHKFGPKFEDNSAQAIDSLQE